MINEASFVIKSNKRYKISSKCLPLLEGPRSQYAILVDLVLENKMDKFRIIIIIYWAENIMDGDNVKTYLQISSQKGFVLNF